MSELKCYACEVTSPLYRNSPKGESPVWACWNHLNDEYKGYMQEDGVKMMMDILDNYDKVKDELDTRE